MAHITKIKASDSSRPNNTEDKPAKKPKLSDAELENAKKIAKSLKNAQTKTKASAKKVSSASISKAKEIKTKADLKAEKKAARKARRELRRANRKPMPKWLKVVTAPFRWLFKPFVKLGNYIHDSWIEIRQVSWPNRKATWQMTGAVLVYAAIFIVLLTLLDMLFKFVFDKLLG